MVQARLHRQTLAQVAAVAHRLSAQMELQPQAATVALARHRQFLVVPLLMRVAVAVQLKVAARAGLGDRAAAARERQLTPQVGVERLTQAAAVAVAVKLAVV